LSAEQGDAKAQSILGYMFDNGQGVIKDYSEAFKWYKLSAEQGDAKAQAKLGVMFISGEGSLQDNVLAHMWLNLAAAQGHKDAQKLRALKEESMTLQQIAEAQKLARECLARKYKGC
jgi:hypothetical protein